MKTTCSLLVLAAVAAMLVDGGVYYPAINGLKGPPSRSFSTYDRRAGGNSPAAPPMPTQRAPPYRQSTGSNSREMMRRGYANTYQVRQERYNRLSRKSKISLTPEEIEFMARFEAEEKARSKGEQVDAKMIKKAKKKIKKARKLEKQLVKDNSIPSRGASGSGPGPMRSNNAPIIGYHRGGGPGPMRSNNAPITDYHRGGSPGLMRSNSGTGPMRSNNTPTAGRYGRNPPIGRNDQFNPRDSPVSARGFAGSQQMNAQDFMDEDMPNENDFSGQAGDFNGQDEFNAQGQGNEFDAQGPDSEFGAQNDENNSQYNDEYGS